MHESKPQNLERFIDPVDGSVWWIDTEFTDSNWHCIWNNGCAGIADEAAPEQQLGCCSIGAELLDDDEAMNIAALAATLEPTHFQHHEAAIDGVIDDDRPHTRVVDGACIFLNRPGFAGGSGCALHIAAAAEGESPLDWKPSICWQLPLKVEHNDDDSRTLRRWARSDWGPGGESMAWCCTERPRAGEPDAWAGASTVAVSLQSELVGLVGPEIAVRLAEGGAPSPDS